MIKSPKILILDEATSNIDAISASYINEVIFNLPKNMIIIIITHKINQIKECDRIIVLHSSKIAEIGNHEKLLQNDGLYKRLYES